MHRLTFLIRLDRFTHVFALGRHKRSTLAKGGITILLYLIVYFEKEDKDVIPAGLLFGTSSIFLKFRLKNISITSLYFIQKWYDTQLEERYLCKNLNTTA